MICKKSCVVHHAFFVRGLQSTSQTYCRCIAMIIRLIFVWSRYGGAIGFIIEYIKTTSSCASYWFSEERLSLALTWEDVRVVGHIVGWGPHCPGEQTLVVVATWADPCTDDEGSAPKIRFFNIFRATAFGAVNGALHVQKGINRAFDVYFSDAFTVVIDMLISQTIERMTRGNLPFYAVLNYLAAF